MEEKLIKVEIRAKIIKKKDSEETFTAFKGYSPKKGWLDLKFVKDCENVPTESGIIYVKKDNMNINFVSKFPTIWVKSIETFERYSASQNVEDYFD